MRVLMRKHLLTAAILLFGLGLSSQAQYGSARPTKGELNAATELARLGVPLQRDSRGVVRWIEATKGEVNDQALRLFPNLPGLEWLEIGGGKITPSGIASLKNCPLLKRLYLHDLNLGGDALPWLADLKNLEALSLQRTGIDGAVIKNLKSPALTVLNLSGDKITDDDMGLIASIKDLEVLALADTKVTGSGIVKLEGMKRLNELNLMNCNILDGDLESFLSMPNLRIVFAAGCSLSEYGVQTVVARFPMLAIFR
jgi:internalin A